MGAPASNRFVVQERHAQVYVMRANGVSFADIAGVVGLSPGFCWEVDRRVQRLIDHRWNAVFLPAARRTATPEPRR